MLHLTTKITVKSGVTPNISSLLGAWSIGLKPFKKLFDELSNGLPHYFKASVNIYYFKDRTIQLKFCFYRLGSLLTLVSSYKKKILYNKNFIFGISLANFLAVLFIAFGKLNKQIIKMGYGTLVSTKLYIYI